eukprot:356044-Chlamydomonas_euryale.AAC.2
MPSPVALRSGSSTPRVPATRSWRHHSKVSRAPTCRCVGMGRCGGRECGTPGEARAHRNDPTSDTNASLERPQHLSNKNCRQAAPLLQAPLSLSACIRRTRPASYSRTHTSHRA